MADEKAWYEDEENLVDPNAVDDVDSWYNQPDITGERHRLDPNITAEEIEALPEMTNSSQIIEGFSTSNEGGTGFLDTAAGMSRRMGTELSQAWLNMTMTDPGELGMQLEKRFPDLIETRMSADGIVIVKNKATGYEAVVNKPGITGQDVLQTIGMVGKYLPATRVTGAVANTAPRIATAMATMGATEAAGQMGEAAAGGEFDPEDVALSAAFGVVPEVVAKPAVALAQRGRELIRPLEEMLKRGSHNTVAAALKYANEHGYRIMTSDALKEKVTPAMQILLKVTDRIPLVGTAANRLRQQGERVAALKNVADDFGVDIDSELGLEIAESFEKWMKHKRFFGFNEQAGRPTQEMIERAFSKEADDVINSVLKKRIAAGNIDEQVVDQVLKSNNTRRIGELFNKLSPEGRKMAQQRFLAEGLTRAGWAPGQQSTIAIPSVFVKFLDKNRNTVNAMFQGEERAVLNGAKEFIRITEDAGKMGKGAGMTAAMAAGAGYVLFDVVGTAASGLATSLTVKAGQSAPVRNLLLRLAHAEGKPEVVNQIMRQLRPLIAGMGNDVLQDKVDMPELNLAMDPNMVKEGASGAMQSLRAIMKGVASNINPYTFLGGSENTEEEAGPMSGSPFVGPGLGALERAAPSRPEEEPQQ